MARRTYAPNRIREVRKSRGMSQEELGAAMSADLTGSTIAKLENGRQALSLDYLTEIARILQADVLDLLEGDQPAVRWVPVIGLVPAGSWGEAIELTDEYVPIPANTEGKHLVALKPDGDSMDLIIAPGSEGGHVLVDRDLTELQPGRSYVVENERGEVTLKKFSADPLALVPCSSNPTHKPIPLGKEPFRVLGRVIMSLQRL